MKCVISDVKPFHNLIPLYRTVRCLALIFETGIEKQLLDACLVLKLWLLWLYVCQLIVQDIQDLKQLKYFLMILKSQMFWTVVALNINSYLQTV